MDGFEHWPTEPSVDMEALLARGRLERSRAFHHLLGRVRAWLRRSRRARLVQDGQSVIQNGLR